MSKPKRWTAECDHAAVLAQAILSGVVPDDSLQSFKDFYGPDGPEAETGEIFNYHTVKGKRNLQLNWKKLHRKVSLWKTNKPDPKTGKRKFR